MTLRSIHVWFFFFICCRCCCRSFPSTIQFFPISHLWRFFFPFASLVNAVHFDLCTKYGSISFRIQNKHSSFVTIRNLRMEQWLTHKDNAESPVVFPKIVKFLIQPKSHCRLRPPCGYHIKLNKNQLKSALRQFSLSHYLSLCSAHSPLGIFPFQYFGFSFVTLLLSRSMVDISFPMPFPFAQCIHKIFSIFFSASLLSSLMPIGLCAVFHVFSLVIFILYRKTAWNVQRKQSNTAAATEARKEIERQQRVKWKKKKTRKNQQQRVNAHTYSHTG